METRSPSLKGLGVAHITHPSSTDERGGAWCVGRRRERPPWRARRLEWKGCGSLTVCGSLQGLWEAREACGMETRSPSLKGLGVAHITHPSSTDERGGAWCVGRRRERPPWRARRLEWKGCGSLTVCGSLQGLWEAREACGMETRSPSLKGLGVAHITHPSSTDERGGAWCVGRRRERPPWRARRLEWKGCGSLTVCGSLQGLWEAREACGMETRSPSLKGLGVAHITHPSSTDERGGAWCVGRRRERPPWRARRLEWKGCGSLTVCGSLQGLWEAREACGMETRSPSLKGLGVAHITHPSSTDERGGAWCVGRRRERPPWRARRLEWKGCGSLTVCGSLQGLWEAREACGMETRSPSLKGLGVAHITHPSSTDERGGAWCVGRRRERPPWRARRLEWKGCGSLTVCGSLQGLWEAREACGMETRSPSLKGLGVAHITHPSSTDERGGAWCVGRRRERPPWRARRLEWKGCGSLTVCGSLQGLWEAREACGMETRSPSLKGLGVAHITHPSSTDERGGAWCVGRRRERPPWRARRLEWKGCGSLTVCGSLQGLWEAREACGMETRSPSLKGLGVAHITHPSSTDERGGAWCVGRRRERPPWRARRLEWKGCGSLTVCGSLQGLWEAREACGMETRSPSLKGLGVAHITHPSSTDERGGAWCVGRRRERPPWRARRLEWKGCGSLTVCGSLQGLWEAREACGMETRSPSLKGLGVAHITHPSSTDERGGAWCVGRRRERPPWRARRLEWKGCGSLTVCGSLQGLWEAREACGMETRSPSLKGLGVAHITHPSSTDERGGAWCVGRRRERPPWRARRLEWKGCGSLTVCGSLQGLWEAREACGMETRSPSLKGLGVAHITHPSSTDERGGAWCVGRRRERPPWRARRLEWKGCGSLTVCGSLQGLWEAREACGMETRSPSLKGLGVAHITHPSSTDERGGAWCVGRRRERPPWRARRLEWKGCGSLTVCGSLQGLWEAREACGMETRSPSLKGLGVAHITHPSSTDERGGAWCVGRRRERPPWRARRLEWKGCGSLTVCGSLQGLWEAREACGMETRSPSLKGLGVAHITHPSSTDERGGAWCVGRRRERPPWRARRLEWKGCGSLTVCGSLQGLWEAREACGMETRSPSLKGLGVAHITHPSSTDERGGAWCVGRRRVLPP